MYLGPFEGCISITEQDLCIRVPIFQVGVDGCHLTEPVMCRKTEWVGVSNRRLLYYITTPASSPGWHLYHVTHSWLVLYCSTTAAAECLRWSAFRS